MSLMQCLTDNFEVWIAALVIAATVMAFVAAKKDDEEK